MSHTLKKYDNICMTIMCTPEDFLSSGKARSLDRSLQKKKNASYDESV